MRFYNFIFSDERIQRLKRHFFFWLAVFFYHCMRLSLLFPAGHLREDLSSIIIGSFTWGVLANMIFSYSVVYYLVPNFFLKKKYVQFIMYLLPLIISDMLLSIFLTQLNRPMAGTISSATTKVFSYIIVRANIIRFFGNPPLICLLLLSFKKVKDWYLKQNENRILARENSNAELLLLKAQIHPHFLFNTLNNIYFFILSEPVKAKDLVNKLDKLLYYIVNECSAEAVPLGKEIEMIHDYFELEKIRYSDIDIEFKITGDYKSKMIAPLLMIPFIENSFKHGTSKILKDPWIKLVIQSDENMLHFVLVNNKPAETVTTRKYGIGLNNVKKRLNLLYPEKYFLNIEPTANTFTVNMQIPMG